MEEIHVVKDQVLKSLEGIFDDNFFFSRELVKPGAIIIRQRGTHVQPGVNVGLGRDYTIYSLVDGIVEFKWFSKRHQNVYFYSYNICEQFVSVIPTHPLPPKPVKEKQKKKETKEENKTIKNEKEKPKQIKTEKPKKESTPKKNKPPKQTESKPIKSKM